MELESACRRKRAREQLQFLDTLTTALSATGMGAAKESGRHHAEYRGKLVKRSEDYARRDDK